jgi:hypothetical protein
MYKDIKLALGAGRDTGAFMPVTALGTQMLAALCNTGRGGLDSAALGLVFRELSEKPGLSGFLCVRHIMSTERNMYAKASQKDAESQRCRASGGVAEDPAGIA